MKRHRITYDFDADPFFAHRLYLAVAAMLRELTPESTLRSVYDQLDENGEPVWQEDDAA